MKDLPQTRISRPWRGQGWGRRRALLLILVSSFALKLALLVPAHQTYPFWDAFEYFTAGRELCRTGEYQSRRPPLYPAVLCSAAWLASLRGEEALTPLDGSAVGQPRPAPSDLDAARLLQVVFSTIAVGLIYLLGRELFDRRAGLVAAGIFAFYPQFTSYSHLLWAETQFVSLNLAWALLLLRGLREQRLPLLFASGALFGFAALTRQVILSFLPLTLVWIFLASPRPGRTAAPLAAAMALGALLVVAPWTVRNVFVHGEFVPIAPETGHSLLFGASGHPGADFERAGVWQARGIERDHLARARAIEIIRDDPIRFFRRALRRNLPGLWAPRSLALRHLSIGPLGYPDVPNWLGLFLIVAFVGSYHLVIACGVAGAALAREGRATLLLVGLVLHGSVLHSLTSGLPRHRLYLMAFLICYAGFFLSRRLAELRRLATWGRITAAAAILILLAALLATAGYRGLARQWRSFSEEGSSNRSGPAAEPTKFPFSHQLPTAAADLRALARNAG